MSLLKLDHKGKVVFVGIDVHKKTYAVCATGEHIPKPVRMGNLVSDPQELVIKLKKTFAGAQIKSVYEAGFSGFVLHRVLVKNGIENIVVNPASIPVSVNNLVKTDKRDAEKMSLMLSLRLLEGIRIPSAEEELSRMYSRTRRQLVEHRTAVANQIKSKLFQFGFLNYDDDRVMSPKLVKELEALDMPDELSITVKCLGDIYRSLTDKIEEMEKLLKKQAESDEKREAVYRSVPGVGDISARVLANELGDMSQFPNERGLFAFTGLTPSEYSSGEKERKGSITHQGNAEIRAILVQIAWRAITKDPELREVYDRLKVKCGGKKAIVAVARRLIGHMRACFRTQKLYGDKLQKKDPEGCRAGVTSVKNSESTGCLPSFSLA